MSDMLTQALELAKKGFHLFPITEGKKAPPAIADFPNKATRDPVTITKWWSTNPAFNIGISTSRFGDGEALVVVDVDNKGVKRGDEEVFKLEVQGFELPQTLEQVTPTQGRHIIYRAPSPVKQGTDVLATGLDIRSSGGYIVGAGSVVGGGVYNFREEKELAEAPSWLVEKCGKPNEKKDSGPALKVDALDSEHAVTRAVHYLLKEAPLSIKGQGGDQIAYKVAARVKDFGVGPSTCLQLMLDHWNDRCPPGWKPDRLKAKVDHAYRYGMQPPGATAPEAEFDRIPTAEATETPAEAPATGPTPTITQQIAKLNEEFAFVISGGSSHILWETTDEDGKAKLEHLAEEAFHKKLAPHTVLSEDKFKPLSKLWMSSPARRSFDGIVFLPGKECPPRFYNLWRGFSVSPPGEGQNFSTKAKRSLEQFLEHAKENVCSGDPSLSRWLIGYFAHLIQRPWEKPLTAPVFKGRKGVGKTTLSDRIGHLLGNHYFLTANPRFLLGNFNSHLENCLMLTLDEAFWGGDKSAEGTLKNLITGDKHVIEMKGKESYQVRNCTRVFIIGNEEWVVPASHDERRYAVFNVGEGRKQDRDFFRSMREGMEEGGYQLLLQYLLDFDISGLDFAEAPKTDGLLEQKINSLEPFYQWWLDCLHRGTIPHTSEFGDGSFPKEVSKDDFRNAFGMYLRQRNIKGWIPDERVVGKFLKACLPGANMTQKKKDGEAWVRSYRLPTLEQARHEWELFIGHTVKWES